MEPGPGQALGRQMRVDAGKARGPGGAPAAPPVKAHLALLQPVDMAAQGLHQRQNLIFPVVFGNGKASAPRVRRFQTHDCNILNVPILFSHVKRRVKLGKIACEVRGRFILS